MATRPEMAELFATAFESKRLIYRTFSKTDADKALWYKFNGADPVLTGLGNSVLLRDTDKKSSDTQFDSFMDAKLLLSVFICLPAEDTEEELAELAKLGPGERATRRRDKATPIGYILLAPLRDVQNHVRFTRIGLSIQEPYQDKGYGGEAINWTVDWAFNYANVHKVEIGTVSYNERAIHLYEKLGFKPEGRKRHWVYMNRKYYDLVEYGLLEDEWEELRGQ